jgi:hypothetical protein
MNRYILPGVMLVLSLTAGTLLYRPISAIRERKAVETDLFTPYFAAIGDGRYAEAWLYHTPAWRSSHSLPEFTAHYQDLISTNGKISRHEVVGTSTSSSGLTVEYQVSFRSDTVIVTYGLIPQPEAGRWGIDRAATATAGSGAVAW